MKLLYKVLSLIIITLTVISIMLFVCIVAFIVKQPEGFNIYAIVILFVIVCITTAICIVVKKKMNKKMIVITKVDEPLQ